MLSKVKARHLKDVKGNESAQHKYRSHSLEEFGKLMFGDWNDEEWCQFDNYMIQCLQLYLEKGLMKVSLLT